MANSKQRTAPQPHKVVKEMSLFLGKFEPQPNNSGWSFTKALADGSGYIKVSSIQKVNSHDGKIFDFVMSSLFAQKKYLFSEDKTNKLLDNIKKVDVSEAYKAISINMSEINKYRRIKNSKQNRDAIFRSLSKLVGMTIEVKKGTAHLIYSILTSVKLDSTNHNILYVKVNDEINQAFDKAGIRFINIERTLPLRSEHAVELTRFLQVRGQGLSATIPKPVRMFHHSDAVYFLHLEHLSEKDQVDTLRRAMKAINNQGYNTYSMKRFASGIKWELNN